MKSPFKFLDSYTKDDRDIFFGREREIEELYHRVFESRIMLVYGISGTGKSSLIHCGLANKFQDTDWLPVVIRRGTNIIDSMAAAIKAASVTTKQEGTERKGVSKKDVLSLYLDHYKPVFFIFDQFEELFIFGDKEERSAFIHIIKSIYESDLQCRMIFILREEYLSGITEFEKFIPVIFSNRVRIEKMSHRNALEAIKGPCNAFYIKLEEGFAESLLEKLSPGSEDVELTYLQVFLDKIFRLAVGFTPPFRGAGGSASADEELKGESVSFTISLLQKTGNVSDLLGSFLDEQTAKMEDPEMAMAVLKAFVSEKGTKRQVNEQEIRDNVKSLGKEIALPGIQEYVRKFVNLRVLREKNDNERYELRHDALAEKIFEKFSTAEKELLEIRQMIENSYQYWLKRNVLLSNEDLGYIGQKDQMLSLNQELRSFLSESRQQQHKSRQTFRRLIFISAMAFLVLISAIVYTVIGRLNSSNALDLAGISANQFSNPSDRLSIAGYAWKTHKAIPSEAALLQSFNYAIENPGTDSGLIQISRKYLKNFVPVSSAIQFAECSKDNRFVFGYTLDSVFIWERNGNIFNKFSCRQHPVAAKMSDNGSYIAILGKDSTLSVRDVIGNLRFSQKISFVKQQVENSFRFTKDNHILSLSTDYDAVLMDLNGNILQTFRQHKAKVNALDISGDNVFIATASSDATINIWYLNSDTKKYDLYNSLNPHKDTVWSVDFAPNNRYIVSASADRSVKVVSINNEVASNFKMEYFNFFIPLQYPVSARFNSTGTAITIETFTDIDKVRFKMFGVYVDQRENLASIGQETEFDMIEFSPDEEFFAYKIGNEVSLASRKTFNIYLPNNFNLLKMEGEKMFFSPDGKYVYSICGNKLRSWYIDIKSISEIALDWYGKWHEES